MQLVPATYYTTRARALSQGINTAPTHLVPKPLATFNVPLRPGFKPGREISTPNDICTFDALVKSLELLLAIMRAPDASVTQDKLAPRVLGLVQQLLRRSDWGASAVRLAVDAWELTCGHAQYKQVGLGAHLGCVAVVA